MNDKLKEAFEIYMRERMLGVDSDQILGFLDNNGYELGSKRRDEAIDAYMKVTNDPVLSTLIPELSSYDLNNPGTDIMTLYGVRKREIENNLYKTPEVTNPQVQVEPKVEEMNAEQSNQEFVKDIKELKEKIIDTKNVMVQEPTLEPSVLISKQDNPIETQSKAKKESRELKLNINGYGYANIVLMSIIVIIIVAIICVFIFA